MAGPEPNTIWIELTAMGYRASYQRYFLTNNEGNRKARILAIGKRIVQGTWRCKWCGDDLHLDKRADSQFCREGCRKRAARHRRRYAQHIQSRKPDGVKGNTAALNRRPS